MNDQGKTARESVDLNDPATLALFEKGMKKFAEIMQAKQEQFLLAFTKEHGMQPSQAVLCHCIRNDGTAEYWVEKRGPQHSSDVSYFLKIRDVLHAIVDAAPGEAILEDVRKLAREILPPLDGIEKPKQYIQVVPG